MDVDQLTRSTLFDLLCGDSENRKYFSHYFYSHVGHRISGWHFRVCIETLEKTLDAHEDIDKHIVACVYIFSRLQMPVS
jgi:hypothetical protein